MEALIIPILFAVVSIIFQIINQESSRSRKTAEAQRQNNLNVPSAVRQEKVFGKNIYNSTDVKVMKTSIAKQKIAADNPRDMYEEGAQTEGVKRHILDSRSSAAETAVKESHISGIELDDLQRSIIMAEILGKPKALRKY